MNLLIFRLVMMCTLLLLTGVISTIANSDRAKIDKKWMWILTFASILTCGSGLYIMLKTVLYFYKHTGGYFV